MTEAEAFLFALPRFAASGASAYAPGLDRIRALLRAMGDPHESLRTVHVAGTNGKGSTASFIAAIATARGLRSGLHTSPHLLHVRERMRIDGAPAPEAWLASGVTRFADTMREIGPSFFEATVALSLLYFAEQNVDLAVVEVGLGGRLDATNVLTPLASVVTHIGLDHTDLLGDTSEAVAKEKAGIAKPDVPFLHALPPGTTRDALEAEARRRGTEPEAVRETVRIAASGESHTFTSPEAVVGPVALGLPGEHQAGNAALALRTAEVAFGPLAPEATARGLREVTVLAGLRGRSERWAPDPRIVLDVAHNPDGWRAALDAITIARGGRLWALIGAMADKDVQALGPLLAAREARVLALGLDGERALDIRALVAQLTDGGADVAPVPGALEALALFQQEAILADQLLITGSHVTVAAALEALHIISRKSEGPKG